MPRNAQLSSFVPRRYDELVALLHGRGFDLAWNTADNSPNEWDDLPPLGLVRVKGVWLPTADEDPDADADGRVTFSVEERWATEPTHHATESREGLWLAAYSYNGHIAGPSRRRGDREHRHDFDPFKASHEVHHLHRFGEHNDQRRPEGHVSAAEALDDFLNILRGELAAGRFRPAGGS